ncbi:hypothetical protein KKB55_11005 [Myxococcota bacterium]|nr:hypothetical protein [Myxococcota bacterium]
MCRIISEEWRDEIETVDGNALKPLMFRVESKSGSIKTVIFSISMPLEADFVLKKGIDVDVLKNTLQHFYERKLIELCDHIFNDENEIFQKVFESMD